MRASVLRLVVTSLNMLLMPNRAASFKKWMIWSFPLALILEILHTPVLMLQTPLSSSSLSKIKSPLFRSGTVRMDIVQRFAAGNPLNLPQWKFAANQSVRNKKKLPLGSFMYVWYLSVGVLLHRLLRECVEAQSPPRVRVWNSHKPNGVPLGFFLPSSRECVQWVQSIPAYWKAKDFVR